MVYQVNLIPLMEEIFISVNQANISMAQCNTALMMNIPQSCTKPLIYTKSYKQFSNFAGNLCYRIDKELFWWLNVIFFFKEQSAAKIKEGQVKRQISGFGKGEFWIRRTLYPHVIAVWKGLLVKKYVWGLVCNKGSSYIDGLVQERRLSCTNPLIWKSPAWFDHT